MPSLVSSLKGTLNSALNAIPQHNCSTSFCPALMDAPALCPGVLTGVLKCKVFFYAEKRETYGNSREVDGLQQLG